MGYLPTVDLEGSNLSFNAACVARARMFHYAMMIIVKPLIDPGNHGVMLTGGDGTTASPFWPPMLQTTLSNTLSHALAMGKLIPKATL